MQALDELNEAKSVYESINLELHEELPAFYNRLVNFLFHLFVLVPKRRSHS